MQKYSKWFLWTMLIALISSANAEDRFVDSDDYKEPGFKKCFINDYSRLVEGDDVDWVWVANGVKLSQHKVALTSVIGKTKEAKRSDKKALEIALKDEIQDMDVHGGSTLKMSACIFDVDDANFGKRFIPFAGGHLAQAGLGVEIILKDGGRTVAMLRHYAREGNAKEDVSEEVAEDIIEFIEEN